MVFQLSASPVDYDTSLSSCILLVGNWSEFRNYICNNESFLLIGWIFFLPHFLVNSLYVIKNIVVIVKSLES